MAKKFDRYKKIQVKYSPEIIEFLKTKKYNYEVHEVHNYSPYQKEKEIEEDFPLIEIDKELYGKLKELSEITGISIKSIVSKEL